MTNYDGLDADVVLVDMDATVRRLSRMILEAVGCRVVEANDGDRALAFIDDDGARIDLLIADVYTCDPSGIDLARRARATRPGLKVLYVVKSAAASCLDGSLLREGERYLAKPYGGRVLASAVRSLLLPNGTAGSALRARPAGGPFL